jgi:hypothetical protein
MLGFLQTVWHYNAVTFSGKLISVKSGKMFILMLIKELCGGVHKGEYPYHVASLHLVSVNVMRQLTFCERDFFFQY